MCWHLSWKEERANVYSKDLPECWMLFVILSPQQREQKWKKNAEKHNEDIKSQRTSILGTIKHSWTEQDRTEVYKVTACWRILIESDCLVFLPTRKKSRKSLRNYFIAVNKQTAVHKARGSAVDLCATGCCQQQKSVRTKATRQTHGRST